MRSPELAAVTSICASMLTVQHCVYGCDGDVPGSPAGGHGHLGREDRRGGRVLAVELHQYANRRPPSRAAIRALASVLSDRAERLREYAERLEAAGDEGPGGDSPGSRR